MWSSAAVLAGLSCSSTGLDDPESEDNEKLRGPSPPTPPPLLLQPERGKSGSVIKTQENDIQSFQALHFGDRCISNEAVITRLVITFYRRNCTYRNFKIVSREK